MYTAHTHTGINNSLGALFYSRLSVRARLRDEFSILVRDFSYAPGLENCLRITVGTRPENDALLDALAILAREEA